jgi:hypothetical protein
MVIHRGNYSLQITAWHDGSPVIEEQVFITYHAAQTAALKLQDINAKIYEMETMELVWATYDQPQGYSVGG